MRKGLQGGREKEGAGNPPQKKKKINQEREGEME